MGKFIFFVAIAVDELPPITTAALRIGLAALAMNLLLRAMMINIPAVMIVWRDFLIMGLLNLAIPFALIAWGQTRVDSGLASIFNATTPFSTAIVAHFLRRDERMTRSRLVGGTVAFAGAALIIGIDALDGLGSAFSGELAVLAATWSYAFAAIFGRRFSSPRFRAMGVNPLVASTGQLTGATALIVPFALAVEHPWTLPLPGWENGAAVAGMSLLSTALASIVYFRILASAGAANSMLVTLLMPVTAYMRQWCGSLLCRYSSSRPFRNPRRYAMKTAAGMAPITSSRMMTPHPHNKFQIPRNRSGNPGALAPGMKSGSMNA